MDSPLDAEVLAADEARYQALYKQDVRVLEPMLHAEYQHAHANGKTDDKAAFLASIQAAKYRFVLAVRSRQRVRHIGTVAFLSGLTDTTIDVGGEHKTMHNMFLTAWVKQSGSWQLVHWQATKIPDA